MPQSLLTTRVLEAKEKQFVSKQLLDDCKLMIYEINQKYEEDNLFIYFSMVQNLEDKILKFIYQGVDFELYLKKTWELSLRNYKQKKVKESYFLDVYGTYLKNSAIESMDIGENTIKKIINKYVKDDSLIAMIIMIRTFKNLNEDLKEFFFSKSGYTRECFSVLLKKIDQEYIILNKREKGRNIKKTESLIYQKNKLKLRFNNPNISFIEKEQIIQELNQLDLFLDNIDKKQGDRTISYRKIAEILEIPRWIVESNSKKIKEFYILYKEMEGE